MLKAQATPQGEKTLASPEDDRLCGVLQDMANFGMAAEVRPQHWQLTDDGVARLEFGYRLQSPQKVCEIRMGDAIADMSTYDILVRLRDGGWRWEELPKASTARAKLWLEIGSAGAVVDPGHIIYYLSTNNISRVYLQCLLDRGRLAAAGIVCVRHGATGYVFNSLFLYLIIGIYFNFGFVAGFVVRFVSYYVFRFPELFSEFVTSEFVFRIC